MTAAAAASDEVGNGDPEEETLQTALGRIDTLADQPENGAKPFKKVTRKHWKSTFGVSRCSGQECQKQFSLLERPHHCRKCGEVFCAACLRFQRKLNKLAHFDPLQGLLRKVCKTCYEEGTTTDGCVRNLTAEFTQLRLQSQNEKSAGSGGGEKFDLGCQRLLEGFKRNVGVNSKFRRVLHEMRNMMFKPDWHKSPARLEESIAESCRTCCQTFGLLRKRYHCKVCGLALCKSCSTVDLVVYVHHDQVHTATASGPSVSDFDICLAIINISGCPDVEPEMRMYLRVCGTCREELIQRQQERPRSVMISSRKGMLEELTALDSVFSVLERKVSLGIREYQDIVTPLENNTGTDRKFSIISDKSDGDRGSREVGETKEGEAPSQSSTRQDLTDSLDKYLHMAQRLKKLVPRGAPQSRLLKNYIRAKCDFYMENMSASRRLIKQFDEYSCEDLEVTYGQKK